MKSNAFVLAIKEFLVFTFFMAIIIIPIRVFIFQPFIVDGESMFPTFDNGDYIIAEKVTYSFRSPKRGDIVILKRPNQNKYVIKRVVGLPTEKINIDTSGTVTVKNEQGLYRLKEMYIDTSTDKRMTSELDYTLGDQEYIVLGDNRSNSFDSRDWGTLEEENIVGKVVFRLFPISNINTF